MNESKSQAGKSAYKIPGLDNLSDADLQEYKVARANITARKKELSENIKSTFGLKESEDARVIVRIGWEYEFTAVLGQEAHETRSLQNLMAINPQKRSGISRRLNNQLPDKVLIDSDKISEVIQEALAGLGANKSLQTSVISAVKDITDASLSESRSDVVSAAKDVVGGMFPKRTHRTKDDSYMPEAARAENLNELIRTTSSLPVGVRAVTEVEDEWNPPGFRTNTGMMRTIKNGLPQSEPVAFKQMEVKSIPMTPERGADWLSILPPHLCNAAEDIGLKMISTRTRIHQESLPNALQGNISIAVKLGDKKYNLMEKQGYAGFVNDVLARGFEPKIPLERIPPSRVERMSKSSPSELALHMMKAAVSFLKNGGTMIIAPTNHSYERYHADEEMGPSKNAFFTQKKLGEYGTVMYRAEGRKSGNPMFNAPDDVGEGRMEFRAPSIEAAANPVFSSRLTEAMMNFTRTGVQEWKRAVKGRNALEGKKASLPSEAVGSDREAVNVPSPLTEKELREDISEMPQSLQQAMEAFRSSHEMERRYGSERMQLIVEQTNQLEAEFRRTEKLQEHKKNPGKHTDRINKERKNAAEATSEKGVV